MRRIFAARGTHISYIKDQIRLNIGITKVGGLESDF